MAEKNEDSVLNKVKAAGSSIGDVVSDFADRFRADRVEKTEHLNQEPLAERLKAAASQARERLSSASGGAEIKAAAGDFASQAESIVKDLFGSASAAASGAKESEAFTQARGLVSETVSSVRGSVDEAVAKVRQKGEETPGKESGEDPSARLDALMSRLRGNAETPDSAPNDDPDIIDGEVISEDK